MIQQCKFRLIFIICKYMLNSSRLIQSFYHDSSCTRHFHWFFLNSRLLYNSGRALHLVAFLTCVGALNWVHVALSIFIFVRLRANRICFHLYLRRFRLRYLHCFVQFRSPFVMTLHAVDLCTISCHFEIQISTTLISRKDEQQSYGLPGKAQNQNRHQDTKKYIV